MDLSTFAAPGSNPAKEADDDLKHQAENTVSDVLTFPVSSRAPKAEIRQPKEVAYFSYDDERHLHLDDSSMGYFYLPMPGNENVDLTQGFASFVPYEADEHLDGLLLAVKHLEETSQSKVKVDILTWRGLMTKILCLPYDKSSGFSMNCISYDGQIFIEEDYQYKQARSLKQLKDDRSRRLAYTGYKFESIACLPRPWAETSRSYIESRPQLKVKNEAQYVSVVRTGIGNCRLLLGGEVDCVWDYKPDPIQDKGEDPLPHYMELKTGKVILTERDQRNFERKLYRIWAQSFLLGIPKVVYAFRDNERYLKNYLTLETQKIPSTVRKSVHMRNETSWDANDSLKFYSACMDWIKSTLTGKSGVWRLQYTPKSQFIQLNFLPDHKPFLADDFVNWRESMKDKWDSNANK